MPIAVGMNGVVPNGGPISPTSPTGPNGSGAGGRMTKAAFFRARSPPIMDQRMNAGHSPNNLLKQFDLQTRLDPFNMSGRHTPDSSEGSHTRPRGDDREELLLPQVGGSVEGGYSSSVGASLGHTPLLESSRPTLPKPSATGSSKQPGQVDSGLRSPESPRGLLAGYRGALAATNGERFDSSSYDDHSDEDRGIGGSGTSHLSESAVMGIAGGSDEMLMTLLAGQAAVDCEKLPVGGWEEVDSWKKELALLSNRLESLVARHQREIKILTAARTLQKLNNANKRMSKQTTESLEQSEKRADAAEKEVLVLRDRESALRRRLMEHWSGVMAWEVRRLERVSTENQLRFDRQAKKIASSKAGEEEMMRRIAALEDECAKRTTRTDELEEMVIEMGRRERAVEEELKELDGLKTHHERERQAWKEERQALQSDTSQRDHDRKAFDEERQNWAMEKKMLIQDREMVVRDRAKALENGRMSDRDRAMLERVRGGLGGILGRKAGIAETEMVDAVEEVKMLLQKREDDVVRLKEEMREVNAGLEEELRRASADRDQMKKKVDEVTKSDSKRSVELSSLQRQLRAQTDQLSDLKLRNESLSTSLAAAQTAVSAMNSTSDSTKSLQRQVDSLTAELDSVAGQFNDIWCDLPQASTRVEAGLVDSRTGQPNKSFSIPSTPVNVEALQRVYQPHEEQFSSIAEMISRVRGMVDDGRIIVERCANLGKERDLLKTNAARAKKLAEDSRRGLETYQQQVAVLEDRLANTGASESRFLDELNSLRTALDAASSSKRQLETQIRKSEETVDRLQQANDILSAKTLSMAEDAENARETLQRKVQDELSEMKRKLEEAQEEADEGRTRGQAQRIQLLDELNSLQAENADMRKQLRAAQRGPAK